MGKKNQITHEEEIFYETQHSFFYIKKSHNAPPNNNTISKFKVLRLIWNTPEPV